MSKSTVTESRPIAKGTYFYLVRLLQSKSYDDAAPLIDAEGVVVRFEDGTAITFGDLRNCRVDNAVRRDNSTGVDYPLLWQLTQSEAQGAIDWLTDKSAKPVTGNYNRPKAEKSKAKTAHKAEPAKPEPDVSALIAAEVARALEAFTAPQSAKPSKVKVRTEPTPAGIATPQFAPGDVILVNGVAVQISADGKRLNKTIV